MTFEYQLQEVFAQHPGSTKPSNIENIIHATAIDDTLSCLNCVLIVEVTMFSIIFTNSLLNRHKEMFSGWKSFHHSSCNKNI